ncbi:alpha/beta hydrolase [Hymenobacter aerilatus]|uniref:Alpha/beta hydrolase n=1 Tax=Hymenobacter aerilatus TaxID=2932251 RepID=A0A8T9SY12_9BACT|nr:alpha/beta hydrolase [Hymenobacter aerilatus]UOR06958.1 alpha/beta hydrolase [Hymenobacter aerilatus]
MMLIPASTTLPSNASTSLQRAAILARNNVHVVGTGKRTLLLCNGFGCSQQIWRYLVTPLATQYTVVLFDHVGGGASDLHAYDPQKYGSLAGYAHDVVEICQALALTQVTLIGHSVGATIAMLAAIQAPAYFTDVILLAPSPCYLNEPGYHGGFEREDIEQLLGLMQADYDSWANLFANLLMGPANNASLGEQLAGYFCQTDSVIAQQFARVVFLSDNRADVPHLQHRTLLVQCQHDVAAPEEVGAYLLEQLPNATLVQLQATGHCPHLSAPLETLATIEHFLTHEAAYLDTV